MPRKPETSLERAFRLLQTARTANQMPDHRSTVIEDEAAYLRDVEAVLNEFMAMRNMIGAIAEMRESPDRAVAPYLDDEVAP